jgi:hypothetical protein
MLICNGSKVQICTLNIKKPSKKDINFETPKIRILYPQNILLQKVIGNILFWQFGDMRIGYISFDIYPSGVWF